MEDLTDPWRDVLARPDARRRPDARTWSALEYACHVRDVCRVFTERVDAMLRDDGPEFPNWDQDATAVATRYHEQDPGAVAEERRRADVRDAFAAVEASGGSAPACAATGRSSTVETLGQYFLHDLAHHLVDVGA